MLLLFRKLSFKMTFDFLVTKRVSCSGQYDRINHLVTFNLGGDKRVGLREFLVGEFHSSAVCKRFNPRFVWHFSPQAGPDRSPRGAGKAGLNSPALTKPYAPFHRDIPRLFFFPGVCVAL